MILNRTDVRDLARIYPMRFLKISLKITPMFPFAFSAGSKLPFGYWPKIAAE